LGEFYEKLRKKEKEINELERQIRDQQIKIENEQKEYDDLVLMVIEIENFIVLKFVFREIEMKSIIQIKSIFYKWIFKGQEKIQRNVKKKMLS